MYVSEMRWIGFSSTAWEVSVTILPVVGSCCQHWFHETARTITVSPSLGPSPQGHDESWKDGQFKQNGI